MSATTKRRLQRLEAKQSASLDEELADLSDAELISMLRDVKGELSPEDEALVRYIELGEYQPGALASHRDARLSRMSDAELTRIIRLEKQRVRAS
ncbi:hypothetical protein JNW90_30815 [Micromonospora sp. STR1s_5]|nr:hypothetical protein [Micromonospora sp. STR1s_5]